MNTHNPQKPPLHQPELFSVIASRRMLYVAFTLLVLCAVSYLGTGFFLFFTNPAKAGLFGDMFGGMNAILTGFTLIALVYTVVLQHREIAANRRMHHQALRVQEQQIQRMDDSTRTRRTIELAAQFFSFDMLKSRDISEIWLRENRREPDVLSELNPDLRSRKDLDPEDLSRQDDWVYHTWKVVEFYELLTMLRKTGAIDEQLARLTFGSHFIVYCSLLDPVFKVAKDENWPSWTKLIVPAFQALRQDWETEAIH